jgi:hypothetical protein
MLNEEETLVWEVGGVYIECWRLSESCCMTVWRDRRRGHDWPGGTVDIGETVDMTAQV